MLPRSSPIAERIRAGVEALPAPAGGAALTVSIGAAIFPFDGSTADALFHAADRAPLRSKAPRPQSRGGDGGRVTKQGRGLIWSAAAMPPLCSRVEHVSIVQLLDQPIDRPREIRRSRSDSPPTFPTHRSYAGRSFSTSAAAAPGELHARGPKVVRILAAFRQEPSCSRREIMPGHVLFRDEKCSRDRGEGRRLAGVRRAASTAHCCGVIVRLLEHAAPSRRVSRLASWITPVTRSRSAHGRSIY